MAFTKAFQIKQNSFGPKKKNGYTNDEYADGGNVTNVHLLG